ncbi:3-deoxy-7-phosphoheptulonate synthase [Streptomyces sp. MCL20-2]|uniref:3-deoxy-7-phosphoheptulonate synthase n=1 Tax=Streptomyces sp. MCL20-2 TaxID=2967219 RepID=UPI002967696D|nr:3-deoxy-7-phosphoheptulonate synthase [Streptomyces sp. MCL20-2]
MTMMNEQPAAPVASTSSSHAETRRWTTGPAAQNPQWRNHPAYASAMDALTAAPGLVRPDDLLRVRAALARVASGEAVMIQAGDCAESFYACTPEAVDARMEMLDRFAGALGERTGRPVLRVGRIGGQYAKPRSKPVERVGDRMLPSFRGHLINSELPSRAARQADPRRMLWAYRAASRTLGQVDGHRSAREAVARTADHGEPSLGPWSSHEALVVDYEAALLREDPRHGTYLASTHLPWIGERTRNPDSVHVRMLASVVNPVGCKIGPTSRPEEIQRLCELLDPHRTPGRLVLIARMGRDRAADSLPRLVAAVKESGHPAVWVCDPMHGNTVTAANGLKTRYLDTLVEEVRIFLRVLDDQGVPPGGLHLEAAGEQVTECIGGPVVGEDDLRRRYTTLCDPRLSPKQGQLLIESCF